MFQYFIDILLLLFLLDIFFISISNAIPFPSFLSSLPALLPNLPTPPSCPWHYPVLGHIILTIPRATPPIDSQLGHPLLHMQLETRALGILVSSYCCSSYRVGDPFSSLDTFSSSFIGVPVFHPIDDCEHPLLYLPGAGIASQETGISGSFQQNLADMFNILNHQGNANQNNLRFHLIPVRMAKIKTSGDSRCW